MGARNGARAAPGLAAATCAKGYPNHCCDPSVVARAASPGRLALRRQAQARIFRVPPLEKLPELSLRIVQKNGLQPTPRARQRKSRMCWGCLNSVFSIQYSGGLNTRITRIFTNLAARTQHWPRKTEDSTGRFVTGRCRDSNGHNLAYEAGVLRSI